MTTTGSQIFDLVRRWEAEDPERVAVRSGERSWTWREFVGRARQGANASAPREWNRATAWPSWTKKHGKILKRTLRAPYWEGAQRAL